MPSRTSKPSRCVGSGYATQKTRIYYVAAREAATVVMSKDHDFVEMVLRHGSPPQLLWITCGNTSNARMRSILTYALPDAMALLRQGEQIVEISGA